MYFTTHSTTISPSSACVILCLNPIILSILTQDIQSALPELEGIAPSEKILELLNEGVDGVRSGKADGGGIDEGEVPLAGRTLEKAAGNEKLRFGSTIGIIVAHEELVEF